MLEGRGRRQRIEFLRGEDLTNWQALFLASQAVEDYYSDRPSLKDDITTILSSLLEAGIKDEIPIYDEEEIHDNCTVQIWRNSHTGQTSIGWWKNE